MSKPMVLLFALIMSLLAFGAGIFTGFRRGFRRGYIQGAAREFAAVIKFVMEKEGEQP